MTQTLDREESTRDGDECVYMYESHATTLAVLARAFASRHSPRWQCSVPTAETAPQCTKHAREKPTSGFHLLLVAAAPAFAPLPAPVPVPAPPAPESPADGSSKRRIWMASTRSCSSRVVTSGAAAAAPPAAAAALDAAVAPAPAPAVDGRETVRGGGGAGRATGVAGGDGRRAGGEIDLRRGAGRSGVGITARGAGAGVSAAPAIWRSRHSFT